MFLFDRDEDGWRQALCAVPNIDRGELGVDIAMSDDGVYLLAGAPDQDNETGRAYIYERLEHGRWGGMRLSLPDPLQAHRWGARVAMSGDGLLFAIGAPESESVHIIQNKPDRRVLASLTAPVSAPESLFGMSLAMSEDGSTLVVGAPNEDGHGSIYSY